MRQGPEMLVKWMVVMSLVVLLSPCILGSTTPTPTTNATTAAAGKTACKMFHFDFSTSSFENLRFSAILHILIDDKVCICNMEPN